MQHTYPRMKHFLYLFLLWDDTFAMLFSSSVEKIMNVGLKLMRK